MNHPGSLLTVRRAAPTDLPTILALLEAAELYTSSVTLDGDVTYLLGLLPEAAGAEADRAVAVLGLEHGLGGASLLRSFTVLAPYRGRGFSQTMLNEAYALMRERGDRAAFLFSADEGEFWKHQGYDRVTPEALAHRLPQTPQVLSGLEHGWLSDALAWSRALE